MVKKLSCVSCGSLKRFPHTFTIVTQDQYDNFLFFPRISPVKVSNVLYFIVFIIRFKSELEICFQNVFCNLKNFSDPILCMKITDYLFNLRMKV